MYKKNNYQRDSFKMKMSCHLLKIKIKKITPKDLEYSFKAQALMLKNINLIKKQGRVHVLIKLLAFKKIKNLIYKINMRKKTLEEKINLKNK